MNKRDDIFSIIAMILGGLGLILPLLAIVGIILAVIAKNKREAKWSYGLGISIAGLFLGLIIYM